MNKLYMFGVVFLLVGSLAMATGVTQSSLKVKDSGSHLVYDVITWGGTGVQTLEVFCENNGSVYSIAKENVRLSKDKVSLTTTINEDAQGCDYRSKATAWFTLGDYKSDIVNVTQSKSRRKVIVPILTPNEIEFNNCNANALNWYNTHNDSRFSKRTYDLMLDVCQFKFDKAQCELDSTKEYKPKHHSLEFECVRKHERHDRD